MDNIVVGVWVMGRLLAALCACAVLSVGVAQATVRTFDISFTASGFPVGAPADPISGSFRLTLDDTVDITDATLDVVNLTVGTVVFTTANVGFNFFAGSEVLHIGGLVNNVSGLILLPGFDDLEDFRLTIENIFSTPTFSNMVIGGFGDAVADQAYGFGSSTSGSVSVREIGGSVVPEPGVWGLMIVGFGALGFAARRRRALA